MKRKLKIKHLLGNCALLLVVGGSLNFATRFNGSCVNVVNENASEGKLSSLQDIAKTKILGEPAAVAQIEKINEWVKSLSNAEIEQIKDRYKKYLLEEITKLLKNKENVSPEDVKKKIDELKDLAEQFYEKILQFVKESDEQGVLPADFQKYVQKKLGEPKPFAKVFDTRKEFVDYCNSKKPEAEKAIKRLVCNLSEKEEADFKDKKYAVNFGCLEGQYCQDLAIEHQGGTQAYAYCDDESLKSEESFRETVNFKEVTKGELNWEVAGRCNKKAEIAFDSSAVKTIDFDKLELVYKIIFYNHPDLCNMCYLFEKKMDPDMFFSWPTPLLIPKFEKAYGIDDFVMNIADRLFPDHRQKHVFKNSEISNYIRIWFRKARTDIKNASDREYFEGFKSVVQSMKAKPHYIDKLYAIMFNVLIGAKIAGYDFVETTYKLDSRAGKKGGDYAVCYILSPEKMVASAELIEHKDETIDESIERAKKR